MSSVCIPFLGSGFITSESEFAHVPVCFPFDINNVIFNHWHVNRELDLIVTTTNFDMKKMVRS